MVVLLVGTPKAVPDRCLEMHGRNAKAYALCRESGQYRRVVARPDVLL